jgi:hypothetical protein
MLPEASTYTSTGPPGGVDAAAAVAGASQLRAASGKQAAPLPTVFPPQPAKRPPMKSAAKARRRLG